MYQQCKRCIMDNTSDKTIVFDDKGICNYCKKAEIDLANGYFPNDIGKEKFDAMVAMLKEEGKGKKYDCLMGISGGLDSSYLLYLGVKAGLRILALHIDDGFDTPLAVQNIKNLAKAGGVYLHTIEANKAQFNDLTRAYMRSGVCNLAAPQDNVLFANLYKFARENNIHYFLSGANLALESILEYSETYCPYDTVNIKDIHSRFGEGKINDIELLPYYKNKFMSGLYHIQTLTPLNFVNYNKDMAINELKAWCGYQYYEAKHLENELTKFAQLYWFYHKFGVDKRKSHLSSLIMSGQISREQALDCMKQAIYNDEEMDKTISFILDKINLSRDEFNKIMAEPAHSHYDYKVSKLYNMGKNLKRLLKGK